MKSDRLFQMMYLLTNHQQLSAPVLAEKLGVSVRTVYRYIDSLSAAGVPIYATRGRQGGVSLLADFQLSNTLVDKHEQTSILAALEGLKNLGVDNGATLEKLSAVFQQKPIDWLAVDPTTWGSDHEQKATFSTLRQAITRQKLVQFNYRNVKNEYAQRKVYPYQVIFKERAWYLSGFSLEKQAKRIFKLQRVDHVILLSDTTAVPQQPALQAEKEVTWHPKTTFVRFQIAAKLKYRILEEFPKLKLTQVDDQTLTAEGELIKDDWLIAYFLSFGAQITVLTPANLRQQMQTITQQMAANYQTS